MNCDDARRLLNPYVDGELELTSQLDVERHLDGCTGCATRVEGLQSLQLALSSPALYHRAPPSLHARLATPAPAAARLDSGRRSLVKAAGLVALAAVSAALGVLLSPFQTALEDRLLEAVVSGHVRALQVDHLTDVTSTDRHTVKPWFLGKLDFSPEVVDLAQDGFPLVGGRLDYLEGRTVAALVYRRQSHAINVFTWPAAGQDAGPRGAVHRGFNIRRWRREGLTYWAVSDLNGAEMDEFVHRLDDRLSASARSIAPPHRD